MRICKTFTFDAAHMLPNHDGKCKELHGHTYKLEVMIDGVVFPVTPGVDDNPEEGMVVDFGKVKKVWKEHLEPLLDHQYLNETVPVPVTTCEVMVQWIRDSFFTYLLEEGVEQVNCRLWETPTSYAETREGM